MANDVILTDEQKWLFQTESTALSGEGPITDPVKKWMNGVVPYHISESMHTRDAMKIKAALDIMNHQLSGCIKFR